MSRGKKKQYWKKNFKSYLVISLLVLASLLTFIYFSLILLKIGISSDINSDKNEINKEISCKTIEENVFWVSNKPHLSEEFVEYFKWNISADCSKIGIQNCFLQNIILKTKVINAVPIEEKIDGISYIQISNSKELDACNNMRDSFYSKYLFYESYKSNDDIQTQEKWTSCNLNNKTLNNKTRDCRISFDPNFNNKVPCYTVKVYTSQYILLDILKVKYDLCWNQEYNDAIEELNSNEELAVRKNGE